MVENLVNGFDYRFRVAAVGLNGTSSEYSDWSPFYSTSGEYRDLNAGIFIQKCFGKGEVFHYFN